MNKFAILLLNFILISPVFARDIIQHDKPVFTDQDLEKYIERSSRNVSPQHEQEKDEVIETDPHEGAENQGRLVTETKDEVSEAERKRIEREFNTIVASMLSQLKAGNMEGALSFFVESRKDKHRRIFKALKENNTLKAAVEGYMGVEIGWINDHLAECGISRNENGNIYSYPIMFMEIVKGVWKIYDF
jgi:hypothetical protein